RSYPKARAVPQPEDRPATVPAAGADAAADPQARSQSAISSSSGAGSFSASPFVSSIGSVVFSPPVTAMIFTIVSSPSADRSVRSGSPNMLASFVAIVTMIAVIVAASTPISQPAFVMVAQVPQSVRQLSQRSAESRDNFAWSGDINRQSGRIAGHPAREVVSAGPSVIEQVAFATPSVVSETSSTSSMAFFMIEARIRMKRRSSLDRHSFGASVRMAKVMRDVQDRVASYMLTVAQIN
ncbi:hypothetical protein OY671_008738, partial [Metschnikowia pulcherrima]